MLFITGQKPILKSKQGAFQIVDIVKLFHNVTKFCKQASLICMREEIAHISMRVKYRVATACKSDLRPVPGGTRRSDPCIRQGERSNRRGGAPGAIVARAA